VARPSAKGASAKIERAERSETATGTSSSTSGRSNQYSSEMDDTAMPPARIVYSSAVWTLLRKAERTRRAASRPLPVAVASVATRRAARSRRTAERTQT
jgi:hypothetical protein